MRIVRQATKQLRAATATLTETAAEAEAELATALATASAKHAQLSVAAATAAAAAKLPLHERPADILPCSAELSRSNRSSRRSRCSRSPRRRRSSGWSRRSRRSFYWSSSSACTERKSWDIIGLIQTDKANDNAYRERIYKLGFYSVRNVVLLLKEKK